MSEHLSSLVSDPWRVLDALLDGPLHPGGEAATRQLLDRAAVDAETRLLDVGCGAGDALSFARDRGARGVGLDRNPPTGVGVVRGDMGALPFRDGRFDVVLGECVLCLSSDLGRTLAEAHRVLRPDGRLAFSEVTVDGDPPTLPAPFTELLCLDGRRDEPYLRDELAAAGFTVSDVRSHREDLLSMRDRIADRLDLERLASLYADRDSSLRDGAAALDDAVEAGRVGYVSVVADVAD